MHIIFEGEFESSGRAGVFLTEFTEFCDFPESDDDVHGLRNLPFPRCWPVYLRTGVQKDNVAGVIPSP